MPTIQKTYLPKVDEIPQNRKWRVIDGAGVALGRVATQAAMMLMGKNKVDYTPHLDTGDFVVVINASKIVLTGKKLEQKIDYRHSGYPGGDRYVLYGKLMAEHPEKAVRLAVEGMLPKNRMRGKEIVRLKVYKGAEHPHAAQFAVPKPKVEKTENSDKKDKE
jgi:large subunit ribosomal protein L13